MLWDEEWTFNSTFVGLTAFPTDQDFPHGYSYYTKINKN